MRDCCVSEARLWEHSSQFGQQGRSVLTPLASSVQRGTSLRNHGIQEESPRGILPPTRASQRFLVVAMLVGIAVLAGCSKKVQVPNTVGLTLEAAGQALASAQLKLGKATASQGSVLSGSKVVSQSVQAGQPVALNSAIDVVVEGAISVPKLVDTAAADALLAVQNAGLKAALKKQRFSLTHWGMVVAQDVPAGTEVAPGSLVTLTVATPPDVTMLGPLITKQPAYARLNQNQRDILDQLLK